MSAAYVALATLLAVGDATAFEGPMRLGVDPPSEHGPANALRKKVSGGECRKWRKIAASLGETYAGARVRSTMVERACAFAEPDVGDDTAVWSWPWRNGGEIDPELPPRLHQRAGAWTIRCGDAGRRERCALIHEARLQVESISGVETVPITTHFVIDTIVGEQRVLWRVLGPWSHDWKAVGREPGLRPANLLRVGLGPQPREAPFSSCSSAGCLMEANVRLSAEVATHLWEGRTPTLTLTPRPDVTLELALPARGFRSGLAELSRLKRREERIFAGR